jgi:uncharacterized protein YcfL
MKKVLILSLLALTGCASEEPIKLLAPEYKVVKIPEQLYVCPVVKNFPDANSLTNKQVGGLLVNVQKNNMICKNSLDSIKKYMDEAEATVSAKK